MKNIDDSDIVFSLEELEELYTRNMITYCQYLNIKTKLLEINNLKEEDGE